MRKCKLIRRILGIALTVVMVVGMLGGLPAFTSKAEASSATEIWDWYGLDAIRENLGGNYVLMDDLDSNTAGYEALASPTANDGTGWEPIGYAYDPKYRFSGALNGQGHEIRDLFIHKHTYTEVGLFQSIDKEAIIENVGMVNADLTSSVRSAGGLVAYCMGTISNCYFIGSVTSSGSVGGLVGTNVGNIIDSYFTGTVTGESSVGGLVGSNGGSLSNSYATGTVTGSSNVGGLVGSTGYGLIKDSHFAGSVSGDSTVGGILGYPGDCSVVNSYYNHDEVLINEGNVITIGALFDGDFEQWLTNGKFLDVNERLSREGDYYAINDIDDFKQLLIFGQNSSLQFRLNANLDFATMPNFYIPYLAGQFDGNGHIISNLTLDFDEVSSVGLFGYIGYLGGVREMGIENVCISAGDFVGGLAGYAYRGTISNVYSTGTVSGENFVGGLMGGHYSGTLSNSYSSCSVNGEFGVGGLAGECNGPLSDSHSTGIVVGQSHVGGLTGTSSNVNNCYFAGIVTGETYVGGLMGTGGIVNNSYSTGNVNGITNVGGLAGVIYYRAIVSNSFYNCDEVLINGENVITIGALFNEDFNEWLTSGKFLDVNERLSQEHGSYVINNVEDFAALLAFGQDASLNFRLESDLDLVSNPDFYIPYLAGEFDGNGHKISNASFSYDFASCVGLFGYLHSGGNVTRLDVENSDIRAGDYVGGLVGCNYLGTVSDTYLSGNITGNSYVGGLVGFQMGGSLINANFIGAVSGEQQVGCLVGSLNGRAYNHIATVNNSYASGNSAGQLFVGGLVGFESPSCAVDTSHFTGTVTGEERVGGLIGYHGGALDDSHSVGKVTGDRYVGGLAGYGPGTLSNSHSVGNITGNEYVGGLVGYGAQTLNNCYSIGNVIGSEHIGGLVGYHYGTTSESFAAGTVTGEIYVGGLMGTNGGTLSNSYATASVTGTSIVGGLIGQNYRGAVSNSYATGSVTCLADYYWFSDLPVGGFAGYVNGGSIVNCFATGHVEHEDFWDPTGKGFAGRVSPHRDYEMTGNFWDIDTSGQLSTAGNATGKTTAEMMNVATFNNTATEGLDEPWDIIAVAPGGSNPAYVWNIVDGRSYPFLSWGQATLIHTPLARASDISGQQQIMSPGTEYTVTADYFDPDGREDLKYCYLRLLHPEKPLTMGWSQATDDFWVYAGEEGENYLTVTGESAPIDEDGLEGYDLTWNFTINDQWPEAENAIDFGVYAWDDDDNTSGWAYDDTKASFLLASVTRPVNEFPEDGQTDVLLPSDEGAIVMLGSSPPVAGASQWQITTIPGDYSSPIFDEIGYDHYQLRNSISVPEGILWYDTTYYWRTRYQDEDGIWTSWSEETSFTTLPLSFVYSPLNPFVGESIDFEVARHNYPSGAFCEWNFGDDITTSCRECERGAIHSYNEPGEYTVTLALTDEKDRQSVASIDLEVLQNVIVPSLTASNYQPKEYQEIFLDGSGSSHSNPRIEITSYQWEFFDSKGKKLAGGETTCSGVFFYWKKKGDYSVKLTVEDETGSTASTSASITVQGKYPWEGPKKHKIEREYLDNIIASLDLTLGRCASCDFLNGDALEAILCKPVANKQILTGEVEDSEEVAAYSYAIKIAALLGEMEMVDDVLTGQSNIDLAQKIDQYLEAGVVLDSLRQVATLLGTGALEALEMVGTVIWTLLGTEESVGIGEGIAWVRYHLDSIEIWRVTEYYNSLRHYLWARKDDGATHQEAWFGITEGCPGDPWSCLTHFTADEISKLEGSFQRLGDTYCQYVGNVGSSGLTEDFMNQVEEGLKRELLTAKEQYQFEWLYEQVKIKSPVELRVYDSTGLVTGIVNGQVKDEIPNAIYDWEAETITTFLPYDSLRYEIVGTEEGSYGLEIRTLKGTQEVVFAAADIPTTHGAVHEYTVDWDALSQGEEGVSVQIDSDGDGIFERSITSDDDLTSDEFVLQTATTVDFDPNTLNLKSKGKHVTAYIELPLGFNVTQISGSTVSLNDTVPALPKPTEIGDYDGDGIPDLMVKFDRVSVQALLTAGDQVEIAVSGEVAGVRFEGIDTVRVIDRLTFAGNLPMSFFMM